MHRFLQFFVFLLMSNFLFAQDDIIAKTVERLENSNKHEAVIKEINEILKKKNLTAIDRLAVQTTLVHKYQELQQWDNCLGYCQQQITLAHQQNNELAEATFYKLIGNTYYHIPDKDKAVIYWEKCIAISELNRFNALLEQCYHNIGSIYLERSLHYDLAEKYLLQSIDLSIANKTTETSLGRLHYRLLATLYERMNRLEKAGDLYLVVIRKSRVMNDSANLSEALMFYSNVLVKQKKYKEALVFSEEALAIAKKVNRLDMVQTALEFYSRNLFSAGNYKTAYEYKNELTEIISKRYSGDMSAKIADAEARFRTAETKHEENLALVKMKKEKQMYILGFIGLFAISGLLLFTFYQRRNAKQKLHMQQQVQEEKERLSRDLHDNLGSQMTLLSNNIENLDVNFKKQLGIDENIEKVKGTSRQLLQTLRETIWILNKEHVSAPEFFDKLVDYTHRFLQSYPGVQLRVEENFAGSKELNSNEALQLFRICQEAITNSCRYSRSEVLDLYGKTEQKIFTISIKDSGKGFNTKLMQQEGHYGLKNMAKRAAFINAELEILSTTGNGVSITIRI